jgi:hypothetical protein
MTAGIVLAGAPSSGATHAAAPSEYREVVIGFAYRSGFYKGPLSGLSRVKGNFHARFLGGRGAAMPSGHPTARLESVS